MLHWQQGPVVRGESQFVLHLFDQDHNSLESEIKPEVILWMPGHGHGSSPVTVSALVDKDGNPMMGHYQVTSAYFIMPGLWEIRVKTILGGQELSFVFGVNL